MNTLPVFAAVPLRRPPLTRVYAGQLPRARRLIEGARSDRASWVATVLLAHAMLGILTVRYSAIVPLHALIVVPVAVWGAFRWRPARIACLGAYIAGSEVLWRAEHAPLPYEVGKYLVVLVFGIALLRLRPRARLRPMPIVYFALLVPSTFIVLIDPTIPTHWAAMMMSFNLSGPFALCVSVLYLSQIRLTAVEFRAVLLAFLAPAVALAAMAMTATFTANNLTFDDESNLATSGGFGPNQVSSTLGLAALFALLWALDPRVAWKGRLLCFVAMLVVAVQSAMTFSRGGLYTAVLSGLAASVFLLRNEHVRRNVLWVGLLGTVVLSGVVLPRLDRFTGGALSARFHDTDPSNRGTLIRDDLRLWEASPLFGVGPGGAKRHRVLAHGAGHTEFTRLLGEHGSLGLIALLLLVGMAWEAFSIPGDPFERGARVALLLAALLSMSHAAMRISAFAFVFGLSHVRFTRTPRTTASDRGVQAPPEVS